MLPRTPQTEINELLERPSESLNVEVKSWLDPNDPAGISKIVRGTFALRNRNGGYFIIGLDDKTLNPATVNKPSDVRATYHTDKIQGIISKYAASLFEIEVAFGDRGGHEICVIRVPSGVRFPLATKAHLDDGHGKKLVQFGQVYFRTLTTNGTPSTAAAQPSDWQEIAEICFDNREADIGRFFRRYVGSGSNDLSMFLSGAGAVEKPTLRKKVFELLASGSNRFDSKVAKSKLNGEDLRVANSGSWEIALVLDPPKVGELPTDTFLQVLSSSNPRYTGWPVWLDSSGFSEKLHRPVVKDNGWEAFIVSLDSWSKHLDFYRFDPNGQFYLHRNLQDDVTDKISPGTALDPILVIIRITEALAVGLAFAKALNWQPEETVLGFGVRWSKLKGRSLESWANPMAHISPRGTAADDSAEGYTELSLDTPTNAIAPAVAELVRPLFVLFDGFQMPQQSIEQWVQRLIERRLNS